MRVRNKKECVCEEHGVRGGIQDGNGKIYGMV